jgi:starch-binding outer membrane protein, SusD/RagB family
MKRFIKYTINISLILMLLPGCEDFKIGDEFLEKNPGTDKNIDDVYSSKVYAEQALAMAYRSLPHGLPTHNKFGWRILESLTDLGCPAKAGSSSAFDYGGSVDASTPANLVPYTFFNDNTGRGAISGIRYSWLYIENVDRVPDMTKIEKEIRKAEAKVIIAYHCHDMLRWFGGMPWIGRSYKPNDDFNTERCTVEAYVDSITGLLDEAVAVLPWSVKPEDDGRMTKAAAMALKVRVLLFAASPLFNADQPYLAGEAADKKYVWYGNYDKARWQRALDAGMDFIRQQSENGVYQLVKTGNPRGDFQAAHFNRGNNEILISSRWRITWLPGMWELLQMRYGLGAATLNLVDMFPMADGTDFSWDNPVHAANPFFKDGQPIRDIRLYETVIVNEDTYAGRKAECYVGGREFNRLNLTFTGFLCRKFYQDEITNNGKFQQFPLLRLPEVYLSIAEALNELDRSAEAYPYINMVRQRAGMPGLEVGMDKTTLRNAILRERVLEYAFEQVRFFDLNRWKRNDIWKTVTQTSGLKMTKTGSSFTYEKIATPNPRVSYENFNPRLYLHPIPVSEINKKYGLIQNPGW